MTTISPLGAAALEGYFQRIGYEGDRTPTLATLQGIHQRHPQVIAFENLNAFWGQPVSLDLPALERKLVYGGRGGYCFEQNGLLLAVLTSLGFAVRGLGARVLWNLPAGTVTPRSHMVLRVEVEGQAYIADVGFGGLTLTAPLRLTPGLEQETPHERFRLVEGVEGLGGLVLQAHLGDDWQPLYQFDLQPQYPCDYAVSNWHVSTHPSSLFVNHLIAARVDPHCRYGLRDTEFSTHFLAGQSERRQLASIEELQTILTNVFGLKLPKDADFGRLFSEVPRE
ncbi:MAG TPA: arylamine N-acetyltransferase [Nodosilinea sp.]|nr:arylamine N-acetyltransferase [Nodosilinea sp.]